MKLFKYILSILLVAISFTACQDFEELELSPNQPTSAPPSLLLNGVMNDFYQGPWYDDDVNYWNQFWCVNYNYYGNNEYNWTTRDFNYGTLRNIVKMEEEALKTGAAAVNPYSALGKFFRAYYFVRMSMFHGDIPVDDALKGSDNITPKYNTQKEVFAKSLALLEEANDNLAELIKSNNLTLAGDIYFGNDLKAWQKTVNSFKLRVLIHLSKKDGDTDLRVKQRFAEVLTNATKFPIFTGLSDNLAYKYNAVNVYPLNPGQTGKDAGRYNMSATYLNTLTSLKDPRTFVVADPAAKKIASGLKATDFEAYLGANSGESLDDMTFKAGNGEYSFVNEARYYGSYTGPETTIQIGYAEMCFNIAEAINRGWATGDAADWYKKGITASMNFYGITDAAAITAYVAQAAVAYKGNNADGLKQILTQKYLAFFQNSGWEAFMNWRRTGVPTFLTGVGTGNGGRIPKRFQYPVSERNYNSANYTAAIQSQFGAAGDDINAEMWLIK